MAVRYRSRTAPRPRIRRGRGLLWRAGGALPGLVLLLVLAAAAGAWRLSLGPVDLPFLARIAEARIADRAAPLKVTVEGAVFTLGTGPDDPSGLRLTGVEFRDPSGARIAAVPQMGARFRLSDAVRGVVAPTELTLFGADLTVTRLPDGRYDLSLPGEAQEAPGGSAFAAFMLALEDGRVPLLRHLRTIRLNGIAIAYDDRLSGRRWQGRDGTLTLRRLTGRLEGALRLAVSGPDGPPTALALDIGHRFGDDRLALSARITGARPDDLADQIPALGFLRPLRAPVSGDVAVELGLAGELVTLTARLQAGAGALHPADGVAVPVASASLDFHIDGRAGRLWLTRLDAETELGRIAATGEADIARQGDRVTGLEARLDLAALSVALPGRLAEPVAFTGGRVRLGLDLDPFALRLREARLEQDAAAFTLWGGLTRPAAGWEGDFAYAATSVDLRQVLALWPVTAAPGARAWVDRAMSAGVVESASGHLRLTAGHPDFALAFAYRDAVASPLPGLPPIEDAAGTGRLDLSRFEIALSQGRVTPPGQAPIDLAGSVFAVPDLWQDPPGAEVALKGTGEIPAVLALIDSPPLGLLSRLGTRTDLARGRAEVTARLDFPLLRELTPAQVSTEVEADLTAVTLSLPSPVPLSAERLRLSADNAGLSLEGPLRSGPAVVDFAWTQAFRPAAGEPPGRMSARFALTPALLAALGATGIAPALEGAAPARLTATLAPGGTRYALEADLTPAALAPPGSGWRKAPGEPGRLTLSGSLTGGLRVDRLALKAGALLAEGRLTLDRDGRLAAARLDRLKLAEALDTALDWQDGTIRLTGGTLDLVALGGMLAAPGDDPGTAAAPVPPVTLALDRLVLTPRLALAPARGSLTPDAGDAPFLVVSGPANGGVETSLTLTRAGPGMVLRLTAPDAGRFLRDTGYFRGGNGGTLTLDLALVPGSAEMEGRVVIRRIAVRDSPVLGRILSVASITGVLETLTTGGLSFEEVTAHFRRSDGTIWLTGGRATGGSLGITVAGRYDEGGDRLDLSGVFSPAYLLNGILGEVPLVGRLLTGERGEGIFGFSYRVSGSAADPAVTVDPLSILAPGAVRGLLTKDAPEPPPASVPDLPALEEAPPPAPVRRTPGRDGVDR